MMRSLFPMWSICFVTMSIAAADGAVKPEATKFSERVKNAAYTFIVLHDRQIPLQPCLLTVHADSFRYKTAGTSGGPFGKTILIGSEKNPARVSFTDLSLTAPIQPGQDMTVIVTSAGTHEIVAPVEIEVETALTEISVECRSREDEGDVPWKDMADALEAAPHSPRFRIEWSDLVFSSSSTGSMIYDRRTKNLFLSGTSSVGGVTKHYHSTLKNISDDYFIKHVTAYMKDRPSQFKVAN